MPVITMNVACRVTPRSGNDVYGKPKFGATKNDKCAVLKFDMRRAKTPTRATTSGTYGHAEESTANLIVLMSKSSLIKIDDEIELRGVRMLVSSVMPVYDVMGRVDHMKVEATIE